MWNSDGRIRYRAAMRVVHNRAVLLTGVGLLAACGSGPKSSALADSGWGEASLQLVPIDTGPSVVALDTGATAVAEARYIEPVYVGVEFDGVVEIDGTLSGYYFGGEWYEPRLMFMFASEDFFIPDPEEVETREYCMAWAGFTPSLADTYLETYDDTVPWLSYKTQFTIQGHDCDGLVDPAIWGVNGQDLIDTFDGARVGLGFAPLTTDQSVVWSDTVLDAYGESMTATYVAMNWADGTFLAIDLGTSFSWKWDWRTSEVQVDDYGDLIAEPLLPIFGIPESYVYSVATYFMPFDSLDLDNLGGPR